MKLSLSFDPDKLVINASKRAGLLADAIANRARIELRREAPVDTGNLRDSHIIEEISGSNKEIRLVGPDEDIAPYAFWIYFGRGWVFPIRAKALHWVNKQGEDVFAKSARPTEPNKYIDRALDNTINKIKEDLRSIKIIQT